jgi:hypothetical protein
MNMDPKAYFEAGRRWDKAMKELRAELREAYRQRDGWNRIANKHSSAQHRLEEKLARRDAEECRCVQCEAHRKRMKRHIRELRGRS